MRIVFLVVVFSLDFVTPAYAYIDPSIASLVLQGLLGGMVAVTLFFGRVRDRILQILGLRKKEKPSDPSDDEPAPPDDGERK